MKQLLTSFVRYDLWANEKLLDLILSLTEEQQKQYIASSFPSVEKTCLHIWDASSIWWQRVQLHEQIVVPSLSFHPSMKDIANGLLHQNKQWIDWILEQDEKTLAADFSYKNLKGDPYRQPLQDIVLHLSNHGTYHRGQLVTLLRQLGVEKIPQIDYILFARSGA
ncbi:MAG: DinB family protein [Bacteroidota bacterium]|nr:DinB family protein [Bacteroidota bacterium]